MAIQLNSGFDVTVAEPLDTRTVVADLTARNNIPSGIRYEGMEVYVTSEQTKYILKGGVTNSDWSESGSGSGGSGAGGINIFGPQTADDYPDVAASGWVAYQDAAGPAPVDGTGGSGSLNLTLTKVTPLGGGIIGASDFRIHKEGGFGTNVQGLGFSKVLSVPPICRGKINEFEEYVHILAANQPYPPGGFSVWAYDVTNGALLGKLYDMPDTPVATVLKLSGKIGIPQTCEQIRIIRHTGASWTLEFTYLFNQMFFGLRTVSEAELGEVDDYPATNSKVLKEIQNSGNLNRILNGTFEGTSPSLGWFTAKNNTPGPVPTFSDRTDGDIAIAFETVAPLYGTRSLKLSRDASNLQGNFLWALITMNRGDEGKILQAKFDYKVVGTYAGDIKCFAANSTTGELLSAVQGETIENTLLPAQHVFKFQAPATYTPTLVLMLFVSGTGANEADLLVDRVVVGDQEPISRGSPETDWEYFDKPIIGYNSGVWTEGTGGGASRRMRWRRAGKDIIIEFYLRKGTSGGTNGTGAMVFPFPDGVAVDRNRAIGDNVRFSPLGYGEMTNTASAAPVARIIAKEFGGGAILDTTDALLLDALTNNAIALNLNLRFPVLGWSSNTVMSNEVGVAKARVEAGTSASQSLSGVDTPINFGAATVDDAGSWNGSTTYTMRRDGDLQIGGYIETPSGAYGYLAFVNGVNSQLLVASSETNTAMRIPISGTLFNLKAGDTVDIRCWGNTTLPAQMRLIQFNLINYGWQQIAAVEKVVLKVRKNTDQSIPNGTLTDVTGWMTPIKDTHGIFNPTTGVATLLPNRTYRVSGNISFANSGTGVRQAYLWCSDANQTLAGPQSNGVNDVGASTLIVVGSTAIDLRIRAYQTSGTALNIVGAQMTGNDFSIESVDGV